MVPWWSAPRCAEPLFCALSGRAHPLEVSVAAASHGTARAVCKLPNGRRTVVLVPALSGTAGTRLSRRLCALADGRSKASVCGSLPDRGAQCEPWQAVTVRLRRERDPPVPATPSTGCWVPGCLDHGQYLPPTSSTSDLRATDSYGAVPTVRIGRHETQLFPPPSPFVTAAQPASWPPPSSTPAPSLPRLLVFPVICHLSPSTSLVPDPSILNCPPP